MQVAFAMTLFDLEPIECSRPAKGQSRSQIQVENRIRDRLSSNYVQVYMYMYVVEKLNVTQLLFILEGVCIHVNEAICWSTRKLKRGGN